MLKNFGRCLIIAFSITVSASIIYFSSHLESGFGLDLLFQSRGVRTPPNNIVIIAMDEHSQTRLGLWQDLTRWRGYHAMLIQQLKRQGAALIIFDLQFLEEHPGQDDIFADAVKSSGNVLVTLCTQKQNSALDECSENNKPSNLSNYGIQQEASGFKGINYPVKLLSDAILDAAPFFLPYDAKNPTIHEAWLFVDALDFTPTLPVTAWAHYLRNKALYPYSFPQHGQLSQWLAMQRKNCLNDENSNNNDTLNDLLTVICSSETVYLDFYGPPKTIRMESYSDVYDGKINDLSGKVIFIGKANRKYLPSQKDYFQMPFSDTYTGNMAGVEIMATEFANLLEKRFVISPLPPIVLLFFYSFFICLILTNLANIYGIAASLAGSAVYLLAAVWLFSAKAYWLPVAIPILYQLPMTWLATLLWSRQDLLSERKRIMAFARRVFPRWAPVNPISSGLLFEIENPTTDFQRDIGGICLATDIEGYTTVAAQHTAHEMWQLLSSYYQVLGRPVSTHKGIITDVAGDSMIAIWMDSLSIKQKLEACLAALEMAQAVEDFNTSPIPLPTRIGLHSGDMTLGRIDAGEASHYRAIGDTVNTASRIQGVNKYLGTQILASACIVNGLSNIIYRPVGKFLLIGKNEPLELVEIIGVASESIKQRLTAINDSFAVALYTFQQGHWQDAAELFQIQLNSYGQDGPARFYLNLALNYKLNPPVNWRGVVALEAK
ncbi:MAG: adenylate/guanylate cyclase domain-containing protein [Methylomonas sp.]|nr:MAG: adenylate/guanylate cyclase domain-containing protein [Methylomonas sp.]